MVIQPRLDGAVVELKLVLLKLPPEKAIRPIIDDEITKAPLTPPASDVLSGYIAVPIDSSSNTITSTVRILEKARP